MQKWILLAVTFLLSTQVHGWGNAGHEAVGIIAEKNLKPAVKKRIQELLQGGSLATASVWPDKIKSKSEWFHSKTYHYVSVPDASTYFKTLKNLSTQDQSKGDILRAMVKAEDILRDTKSSDSEKAMALKFMVHFVGDLHQPLHVGYPEDKGGNDIKMLWFGVKSNLHKVIDVDVIDFFIDGTGSTIDNPKSGADYLKKLRTPSASEITKWQNSYIMDWSDESLDKREFMYENVDDSSQKYYDNHLDPINERVLQAGYRLAAFLNAIFSNEKFMEKEALKMRMELRNILGKDFNADVALEPQPDAQASRVPVSFFSAAAHDCSLDH